MTNMKTATLYNRSIVVLKCRKAKSQKHWRIKKKVELKKVELVIGTFESTWEFICTIIKN